ncbi:MAG: hypothetical protein LQ348_004018 [Seirophora lacunosa]|nr:MAG: hypothetical protein LQ348_004018 [Seirophora lacunosa]
MQVLRLNDLDLLSGLALAISLSIIYVSDFLFCVSPQPDTGCSDRHIWIWQCHQIYGPIFRYRPDGLLFNSSQATRDIYETKANVKKGDFYEWFSRKAGFHNTWNCVDKAQHARKRRILNAAFSDKALKSAERYIVQHADRWCELLLDGAERAWSSPRNLTEWSDRLIFDILGELCYARSFDIKEPGDNDLKSLPGIMATFTTFAYMVLPANPVISPRGLDALLDVAAPKNVRAFIQFSNECLHRRLDEEKDTQAKGLGEDNYRKDMFHYLFRAKDPETGGPGFMQEELFEESDLLVVAGADNTSMALAVMFFYLVRNAKVYERLTEEIRKTFRSSEDIHAGPQLSSCRYLRAFIDEAMRMNPPVGADLNREVLASGMHIDGHFVREGTNVGVAAYTLQHNDDVFADPFAFRPERWIADEKTGVTAEDVAACEAAFAPFSIGPRACPGKKLAYLEISITMAKVLYLSDVQAVEGDTLGAGSADLIWGRRRAACFQSRDTFVSQRDGPMVQFRSRRA